MRFKKVSSYTFKFCLKNAFPPKVNVLLEDMSPTKTTDAEFICVLPFNIKVPFSDKSPKTLKLLFNFVFPFTFNIPFNEVSLFAMSG